MKLRVQTLRFTTLLFESLHNTLYLQFQIIANSNYTVQTLQFQTLRCQTTISNLKATSQMIHQFGGVNQPPPIDVAGDSDLTGQVLHSYHKIWT